MAKLLEALQLEIKNSKVRYLIFTLFIYLAYPVWFHFYEDFDPSGKLGIADGLLNGDIFGVTNIFGTYGALGVLTNRLPVSGLFWWVVLFDIGICWMLIAMLRKFMDDKPKPMSVLFSVFLLLNISFQYDSFIVILAAFQLFLFSKPDYDKNLYWQLLALGIAVLGLFIKSNYGLVMLPVFFLATSIIAKMNLKFLAIQAVFAVMMIWAIALGTHTDISSFLAETTSHIEGYNSVLLLYPENEATAIKTVIIIFLALAVLCISIYQVSTNRTWKYAIINGVGLFYLFILFKSSIVRADDLHLNYFLGFVPLLSLQMEKRLDSKYLKYPFSYCCILIGFVFIGGKQIGQNNTKVKRFAVYVASFFQTEAEIKASAVRKFPIIPKNMLAEIGQRRVTCIPYNYSVVSLHKGLNPVHIPLVQSLYCYNSALDSLNAEFYRHDRADFILEHLNLGSPMQSICMENTSYLERKAHYYPRLMDNDYVLLARRPKALSIQTDIINQGIIQSDKYIVQVAPNKVERISFSFEYGIMKKFLGSIYKYPNVKATVFTGDTTITSTIAYSHLERGILLNTVNSTTEELAANYSDAVLPSSNKIKTILFDFEGLDIKSKSYRLEAIEFK